MTEFTLKGNRSLLREDHEMSLIDKAEADNAFKSCKKRYLDTLLKSKGFAQYKTNAYVRRNQADMLEYIDLQKERYGSKTFTVNYALTPLYIHYNFPIYCFNNRLGMLICKKDVWWDYADEDIASVSFENVADAIEEFVLPWFEAHSNDDLIKRALLEKGKLSIFERAWLDSIDNHVDCSEIIEKNIELFKLPKSQRQ